MKQIFIMRFTFLIFLLLHIYSVQSAIIYTDIDPDGVPGGIDFNQDGVNEFDIADMMTMGDYLEYWAYGPDNNIHALGDINADWDVPDGVANGFAIGPGGNWVGAGDCAINGWGGGNASITANQDEYIAARFNLGANIHYGWIRISVDAAGNVTYKDYAYNDDADTPINAGDEGGGVTPPLPVAEFTADNTVIQVGGTINYTDQSTNNPNAWNWTFAGGTPTNSTTQNPAVTYNTAGTYTVTLEVTNANGNDTETKVDYITVNPVVADPPVAEFTANNTVIQVGGTVSFTDQSTNNPDTWNWTFTGGTPANSNQQNPTVTYNTAGTYAVELEVSNNDGNDTELKNAYITVNPINGNAPDAEFVADVTAIPVGGTVNFTDQSSNNPDTWNWTFVGGTPANSTNQNPAVVYNTVGQYTVTLEASNADGSNTEIKDAYIEVFDPNLLNIVDFTGTPTTINITEDVAFDLEVNQPDNIIDSVRWIFQGADEPWVFKTNTNTFDVTYSTGGIFDVEVRVYRNGGLDGDTLIKEDYITVIAPDSIPVANFTASSTNIPMGTSIDFINLTTNIEKLDSVKWIIETEPGVFVNSTDLHPANIQYPLVGDFDVELMVYSPFGNHDTIKWGYIHVFDENNLNGIEANFNAITPRLIQVGESVRFEDFSTGDIQDWTYIIDRRVGDAFISYEYEPNPEHTFLDAGFYNVTLIASNATYSDTIVKENYIIVTTTPWPGQEGYCDTLTAMEDFELIPTYRAADNPSWGYFPGHYAKKTSASSSSKYIKRYAQKFETYTPDVVSAILLPVAKSYYGDEDAYITIRIWDADENGLPNEPISGVTKNKVKINSLQERMYNYIELETPVEVDSVFFVGFKLDYKTSTSAQDSFATYMAPERPNSEDNSLYVSRYSTGNTNGYWQTPSQFLGFDLNTAMAVKVLGCVVSVPELAELEASLNIYPNPAKDRLFIDFGAQMISDFEIEVYDIVGKKVHSDWNTNDGSVYELNLSGNENGFYLVNIIANAYKITKKILIQN